MRGTVPLQAPTMELMSWGSAATMFSDVKVGIDPGEHLHWQTQLRTIQVLCVHASVHACVRVCLCVCVGKSLV